jgi:alginate O-acetyltransferase complex protein AlgI
MVFSSILFLLYFLPVFLVVYYMLPYKARNPWVLAASIFFYAWGAPDLVFIILLSLVADFYLVKFIPECNRSGKRWLAGTSILLNVGLLAYFKYANFFIDNVNELLAQFGSAPVSWTAVALPIGISFFTFQKITYAVDVYRGVHGPLRRLVDYAMYILMFPQLIAGPIVRFNEVADQIEDRRKNETAENRIAGLFRFVTGLAKKVLIANVMGAEADRIFAMNAAEMGAGTAWIGVLAYAFQIYFDFSGYSDMAIGLGRMMGFKFPENFNNPYISQSISEFWRRWHMTLGRFMRDYLYIPLGGSRVKSPRRLYLNLWLVFLISGLWHGAAWNFVVWGAFHGLFLIADRIFLLKLLKKTGKYPAMLFTFFITLIGWVLFRADNLSHAIEYLDAMFSFAAQGQQLIPERKFIIILLLAILFSFSAAVRGVENWQVKVLGSGDAGMRGGDVAWRLGFSLIFFLFSLAAIISSGFNPFIYFRF